MDLAWMVLAKVFGYLYATSSDPGILYLVWDSTVLLFLPKLYPK